MSSTVGKTRRNQVRHSDAMRSLIVLLMAVVFSGGCVLSRKRPVAENVITSRELSLNGLEAMERGQWQQAERLLARAIDVCPTDERTHIRYAETLWRRGSVEDSLKHMNEAIKLSGGDPQLLVRQGEMFLALGELEKAGNSADLAIAGNRELASAWALRGDVLFRRQHLDDALSSYHRSLDYEKCNCGVRLAVARIYGLTNQPQRSLTTLAVLSEHYRPGTEPQEVLFLEGLALKELRQYPKAIETLVAASQRGPQSADILYHLADAHWRSGDSANARLSTSAALKLNPYHAASLGLKDRLDRIRQQSLTAAIPSP